MARHQLFSTRTPPETPADVERTLDAALDYAREYDYAGWDPYDGLESPVLDPFARNWFLRLVVMHGVHKSPVNLRPLLRVPKRRNAKGIALFATAYLDAYDELGEEAHLEEAEDLLGWLLDNRSASATHSAWGYPFDWQNSNKFFLEAYEPSIVASVFCAQAFVRHYEVTGDEDSLAVAEDTCRFVTEEVNTVRVDGHRAYAYTPFDDYVVVNANALGASLLAVVGDEVGNEAYVERADEVVDLVLDVQDEKGAWYYSVPASGSHLSHDNFHTGFVLESLHDYLTVRPEREDVRTAYDRGIEFYRRNLFDEGGAPKFEHDSSYPRDVHASAQAIRTFVKDGSPESVALAREVYDWTVEHLMDPEGYFYRRRGRVLDDRTPYMRWSQAWSCYALGTALGEL
ncbi:hypothetical protein [Halomarina litorea]|uniref:hypothetical protein n=1 Tax=Halomarina litorea TaxID=2961595 RepID=UPI0020C22496|nr:hypothetical protein [Halomarina sp. BCD28]